MTFEQLVIAILSGTVGAGTLIAGIRLIGPLAGKFVGSLLKTRAELDADRDKIILNLRAAIDDLVEQLDRCKDGWAEAKQEADSANERVAQLEGFIDRFLARYNLDRDKIEKGEPWPFNGSTKKPPTRPRRAA